ncbi:D-alanyl-D-alanine carboxypeptidase family protein [Kineococcus sp. LSe6-4]|uniref:D-alanyl-D-alanine carboxypeptidase family protein n=1 Tax=Kineococcus halophytocola TaxID=3234027 RepID=A0ABV4H358_9ACTN
MRRSLPSALPRRTTRSLAAAAVLVALSAPQAGATTVPTGQDQLTTLAAQAASALETYQQALQAQQDAQVAADAAQQELAAADAALAASREEMGDWASQAYRGASGFSELSGVAVLLDPRRTGDVGSTLATIDRVGGQHAEVVETAVQARARQEAATARASAAVDAAHTRVEEAAAAKATADAAVQQQLLAYSEAQRTSAGLGPLAPDAAVTDRARAFLSSTQTCAGGTLTGFPNGLLPLEALCPLPSAPGMVLRADAAHAFEALSQAFQADFGTPLAVTDAYRSLAAQVDVKARKPGLAAAPGTSRHGLGLAVDLGGGVQDAGSVQHQWMDRNAALFGFVNPAWAQGSPGPFEPWHWEFVAS